VIVVVQTAPPDPHPPSPPDPPEKVQPEVREYNWQPTPQDERQFFSVALRDGTVHEAKVVWHQLGVVYFITPAGQRGNVPASSLDHDLTQRLNGEKNLRWNLP
jgi:hypothetical protein